MSSNESSIFWTCFSWSPYGAASTIEKIR